MFHPCKVCGSPAVEQTRGALTPGDKGYVPPSSPGQETSNNPANAPDTRVICGNPEFKVAEGEMIFACDNATGWNKQDFADYTRFVWNRDHGAALPA